MLYIILTKLIRRVTIATATAFEIEIAVSFFVNSVLKTGRNVCIVM